MSVFVKLFLMYLFAYVIITSYCNGPPTWGLGEGLTTPHNKKPACYKISHRALELVVSCEHGNELLGSMKGKFFD
jgi:hypothetical protein